MKFLPALTLLFIALKLLDKIDWSWGWVLSPTLIPVGLLILWIIADYITNAFAKE